MRYRKKPVVIDAIQWTGDNYAKVFEFTEGNMVAEKGCYIIRVVNGEYYSCQEDIFNKTYEPVKQ